MRSIRTPHRSRGTDTAPAASESNNLPCLLTTTEIARTLKTSRAAVYVLIARGKLPGIVRIGRRVLVRTDIFRKWLDQQSEPTLQEQR